MEGCYINLKNITKTFGSVVANNSVNLGVKKGEIHAILGENGSGKSTLVNMLSGIYAPDSGEIYIKGEKVTLSSPKDAINHGVGMVHQHFKLVEVLTAKENITLGQNKNFFVKGKKLSDEINKIANKYGLFIDPDKKVYNMSVSEKQTVEILKALYRGADVLILDEPTAVLTPQEIKNFFEILKSMKKEGCAIILITHKLAEVMEISDRVTILRKGESVGTVNTADVQEKELIEMMVGRAVSLEIDRPKTDKGEVLLKVEGLTVGDDEGIDKLKNLSFEIKSGEILGVAGIAGSGQKELCEVITGLCKSKSGSVIFKDEEILGMSPRSIIKKGISMSFIPEDRLGMGLVGGMDIIDNVILKTYQNTKGPFIRRKEGREAAKKIVDRFSIVTSGLNQPVKDLSGGNIQKVLIGREIELQPSLIITAYPVRGLDIGASYNIYDILNEQKKKGIGILFIGEDLDVLLGLCDRIMVISGGEITGMVSAESASKEEIGLLMLGGKGNA